MVRLKIVSKSQVYFVNTARLIYNQTWNILDRDKSSKGGNAPRLDQSMMKMVSSSIFFALPHY